MPKMPPRGNPVLETGWKKKIEDRVSLTERRLDVVEVEVSDHDQDIAMLADILHRRGFFKARMKLASRSRAPRGRGR